MRAMETFFVTVGPEGEFEIPQAICELLKIVEGTRVSIETEGPRIILTLESVPAEPDVRHEWCAGAASALPAAEINRNGIRGLMHPPSPLRLSLERMAY